MKQLGPRLIDEVLRRDLVAFTQRTFQTLSAHKPYIHNWHVEALGRALSKVAAGETRRLLIALPPRHLKSTCASVAFPAWLLGRNPSLKVVCASYAEDLAGKLAMDCRIVMRSAWYRRAFPGTSIGRDKDRELDFVTTARGGRYTTSVGGSLTGRGGDIIIVDDPLKPTDAMSEVKRSWVNEWYDRTLCSRLDDKKSGAIVVVGQRLHFEDLIGYLLGKEEGWEYLCLPAIAEVEQAVELGPGRFYTRAPGEALDAVREPVWTLERLRGELGSFNFSAQYQQCPVPPEGELIKWAWFKTYQTPPRAAERDGLVQSWDTACKVTNTSDYSVCTTWQIHDGKYYLLDVLRERLLFPDLRRRIVDHAKAFGARTLLIEDKGSGTSLLQDLSYNDIPMVREIFRVEPVGDKVLRMSAQSATIEAGRVYIPERAAWLNDFRTEILQFPNGRHDDQVDTVSQFLKWAERNRSILQIWENLI